MANWLKYLLAEIGIATLLAVLVRCFVGMLVHVKGRSMQDTLQNGEFMFALRRRLCGELKRFDVVICRYPGRKGLFVKRIVGLPGEEIAYEQDVLRIDGAAVAEDFPRRRCLRAMELTILGPDEYFLMGDNRPSSHDSRSRNVGPIPLEDIIGVCRWVVLPPRRIRRIR